MVAGATAVYFEEFLFGGEVFVTGFNEFTFYGSSSDDAVVLSSPRTDENMVTGSLAGLGKQGGLSSVVLCEAFGLRGWLQ